MLRHRIDHALPSSRWRFATPAFRKAVRTKHRVFGSLYISPTGRHASAGRTVSVRS